MTSQVVEYVFFFIVIRVAGYFLGTLMQILSALQSAIFLFYLIILIY